jgi:plastocyanin
MRLITLALISIVAMLALAAPTFAAAKANALTGTDGPGFTISMSSKATTGTPPPKTVKAGKYTITIHDRSSIHDFHLTGPGVNKATSVAAIGTTTWKVTLKKGTYHFVCDPHRAIMHGILKVT